MKKNTYMDRAMKSRDPRFSKILGKLGYDRRDMVPDAPPPADVPVTEEEALQTLRARYKEVIGRSAYHAWDADTLRRKIEEAGN